MFVIVAEGDNFSVQLEGIYHTRGEAKAEIRALKMMQLPKDRPEYWINEIPDIKEPEKKS